MADEQPPWESAVREIEARIPIAPERPILFAGSSTMTLWRSLKRDFDGLPVFNAGFGGATMEQVLQRARRVVLPLQPRQIVLFAGENDLALGRSVEQVLRDLESFSELTAPVPLVVLSVKPSPARMEFRSQMEELNGVLATACDYDHRLTFLDVWKPMLNEAGEPRAELWMRDGIHINRKGYALWTELIRPHLQVI